jgi:hypothetical protein
MPPVHQPTHGMEFLGRRDLGKTERIRGRARTPPNFFLELHNILGGSASISEPA